MSTVPWKGYFTSEPVRWRGGCCAANIVCVVPCKYLNIISVSYAVHLGNYWVPIFSLIVQFTWNFVGREYNSRMSLTKPQTVWYIGVCWMFLYNIIADDAPACLNESARVMFLSHFLTLCSYIFRRRLATLLSICQHTISPY